MRRTARHFRERTGRRVLDAENAIRKVSIVPQDGSDWNILGYEYVDPESGETICEGEDDEPIPVFQGIGIYAKPVGPNGEGLMLHIGNQADNPALAAIRDEDGRLAFVETFGEPSAGEIAIFNGQGTVRMLFRADGTVEVGSGAEGPLATLADVAALRGTFNGHTHLESGATTDPPLPQAAAPVGTTKLKAE